MTVIQMSEQDWPDGCLGLPRGKEGCTTAIVPGWIMEMGGKLLRTVGLTNAKVQLGLKNLTYNLMRFT